MRSTGTLFTGLVAASAVAASPRGHKRVVSGVVGGDKVVAYWGNTGYNEGPTDQGNIKIDDLCTNDAVDKVIMSFLTEFPDQTGTGQPVLNFANSCGKTFAQKPGVVGGSSLLWCPEIEEGLQKCKASGKEILLSLGGAWPKNQQFLSPTSAEYLAQWIWDHFGNGGDSNTERPFGAVTIDGIDLDIEAGLPSSSQQYFPDFITKIKQVSAGRWKIGGAPQCITPDANLGTYLQSSWFDYIFVQLYNTPQCSAKAQLTGADSSFADKWLTGNYAPKGFYQGNNLVEVYAGLPASLKASNGDATSGAQFFLQPDEVRQLVKRLKSTSAFFRFGGISLWDATFDAKNPICGKPYSYWVKKAIKQALNGDNTPIVPNGVCPISSSSSSIVSSTSSKISSSSSSVISSTSSAAPSSSSAVISSSSSAAPSSSSALPSSSKVESSSSSAAPSSSSAAPSSSKVESSSASSASPSSSKVESSSASSASPSSSKVESSSASSASPSSSKASSSASSASPSSSKVSSSAAVVSSSSASHGGNPHITSSTSSAFPSLPPFANSTSSGHHGGPGPRPTSSHFGGEDGGDGGHHGGRPTSSVYGGAVPSKSYGGDYEPVPSKSYGGDYDHPVVSSSSKPYGGDYGHGHPTATKTSTTTYVDVCPTGLTTKTATYTRTCYEGEDDADWGKTGVPEGWTVTVTEYVPHYGAKPTPITVTKPCDTPAPAPAKPTGGAGGDYSKPGKPEGGKADGEYAPKSTMVVVVTPVPVAEYGAYVAKQSAAAAAAAASYAPAGGYDAKPNYGSGSGAGADYSAVAKPVAPSKVADSWPQGTYAAAPKASGTKAGSYAPQFTGAASSVRVGLSLFAGAAVAAIAAF